MEEKKCIFNDNKFCDDCGKCDVCDLDPTKKCNNCGKCLEEQGIDLKAIKIDEIIEDNEYTDEVENGEANLKIKADDDDYSEGEYLDDDYSSEYNDGSNIKGDYIDVMDMNIEFIDDINGLSEVLDDNTKTDNLFEEEFPGLIKLKPSKYNN